MIRYLLLLLVVLSVYSTQAQDNRKQIDSLLKVVSNAKEDSNKVGLLNRLALLYRSERPKTALKYSEDALRIASDIQWKDGMSMAYNTAGSIYKEINDYPKALDYLFKSLKINEDLKHSENVANNLGNIGNVYRRSGDLNKAQEYFNKALAINEKLNRSIGITNNLTDMGIICGMQENYDCALDYFNRALKIAQASNDQEGVAIIYGNIANTYAEQGSMEGAVENFLKALQLNEQLGRKMGIAVNLINLGSAHYKIAVDTGKRISSGKWIPKGRETNLAKSEEYFNRSISLYSELSSPEGLQEAYKNLSQVYAAQNDYKKALIFSEKSQGLKDSIFSVDNKVKLANLGEERAEFEKDQQIKMNQVLETKRRNETALFVGGIILLLVITGFVIRERRKSDKLLLNILPAEVADELKRKGDAEAKYFDEVTVLFTDFVNFTALTEKLSPQMLVDELHTYFKAFDNIVSKYKIEKIKTVGDAYLAVCGLPVADKQHAVNVVKAAIEILDFVQSRKSEKGEHTFDIRIGVHSGSVVAGIVGVKKFAYDIWGDTVNTAARMEQSGESGRINISQTTYDLVKDKFACTYRGELDAKNKGLMAMYFVEGAKA